MYDAGWSLHAATLNQELTADNLAHATTPGYRRQGLSFAPFLQDVAFTEKAVADPAALTPYTNFTPGPLIHTEQPFDLALTGDAFFVLDGPSGPVYTRSGAFELSPQGDLQARNGMTVRGQGGRINIPNAASIQVTQDGVIRADGSEVGRLQIARFDNPAELRRVGTTLFEGPAPREPEPGSFRVEQGFREGANVEAVQEMINMMIGMRQYEAAERTLRAMSEAIALNTRPQG
jgi:flagellar basal body rod protein FlgG